MYWIFFIWHTLDAIWKKNMIIYYVDSKRTRDRRIPKYFREFYSFFITRNHCFHVQCASKFLWKRYVSFCLSIKRKSESQSGYWKVKDEQSKHSNIIENFRFLSTTVILYVFSNEQEICSKHDATFIVNYSDIKEILNWSKVLITKKTTCRLFGWTPEN